MNNSSIIINFKTHTKWKKTHISTKSSNKRALGIICVIAVIMLSLIILQITIGTRVDGQGFNWSLSDFVVAGFLLLSTGLLCESVLRILKNSKYKILICAAILFSLVLVWAELAVGIFGTPFAG